MSPRRLFWTLVLSSSAILAVTMGMRQSTGLFLSPLNSSTGLGIVTISFAMAIGQFVWGAAQPLFGMLADRVGSYAVIVLGARQYLQPARGLDEFIAKHPNADRLKLRADDLFRIRP